MMLLRASLYISGVAAVAPAVVVGSLVHGFAFPDPARLLAYASLACIASTMKVRLPGLQASISVNFVFILIAITFLTLAETLILAIPATIVQCLWRPKTRPKAMQVLFNASTVVIAAT